MKSLTWYANRLLKMSFPEIVYRVKHKIRKKIDKQRYLSQPLTCTADFQVDLTTFAYLSKHVTRERLQIWVDEAQYPLYHLADRYCRNHCNIFGIDYDFGDHFDWHLDPKTGNRWPLKFCFDVDIRDGFTIGGPKFVWETNRLYCLNTLGLAFRLTGEEKFAAKIFEILADWIKSNPYPQGVNWTSGIELSIRIANLIWGLSFLEKRKFSEQETALVSQFFWLHGRHLYRYPSKYSSNNNHAIAEAFALFLIGVYGSCFPEASKWFDFGKKVIEREVKRQILPDGGSYEYTTTYLSFVFDFFLLFKVVCEQNNITYDPIVDTRLEQACEYIYTLMDKNGNLANIGDQDSAILVNFGLDNHENFQAILNTGSVLYNRPEFRRDNFPDLKTSLILGNVIKRKNLQQSEHVLNKSRLFGRSGLAVIRGKVKDKEFVFTGNATPLGMPPLYAHGHLDALSFTLSLNGLDFLVDPGTYLYHSGGKWRRYFRSTAAHNTIRINKTDMSEQVADFMFGNPYNVNDVILLSS